MVPAASPVAARWTAEPSAKLGLLLGIAVTEREASLLLADPVLAVGDAAAEAFVIVLELLRAPLLPVEVGPPSRLRLSAMKADEVGHELPRLGVSACGRQ